MYARPCQLTDLVEAVNIQAPDTHHQAIAVVEHVESVQHIKVYGISSAIEINPRPSIQLQIARIVHHRYGMALSVRGECSKRHTGLF
jgi:hypothetical protein